MTDAPLAGPEEAFRRGVLSAAERACALPQHSVYIEVEGLIGQYAKAPSPDPDERHPLPGRDRADLRTLYGHYRKLREHPLLPFKEPVPLLSAAFAQLDWEVGRGPVEDLSPADVLKQLRRVERQIVWLVHKHSALKSVHELCRMHQQKWSLAGPLAPLDAPQLRQVLASLVGRHLVLREADGSFTAHPAVRDHFARLGSASERGRWHELLRRQLMSLVHRPGLPHPQDRLTLDLVEEAIHHAREAGQITEAIALYEQVLGGLRHLGWKLGEMVRGLRILRGFDPCPDRWALAWFLRSLGELEEAWARNDFAYFRADIRLLQGRLPEVAREGEDTRTAVAEFLMGAPPSCLLPC